MSTDAMTVQVALADLQPDAALRIEVGGVAVAVTLVDGVPRAIADTCPHRGVSLATGVWRDGCVTCPAHFWRFSAIDGMKQGDAHLGVPTYPCRVEGDRVHIEVTLPPPPRSMREILLAAARAPSPAAE